MDNYPLTLQPRDGSPHLNERGLARRWGVSCRTLQRMRATGTGPVFLRIGNAIRYPLEDVLLYEDLSRRDGEGAA